MAADPLFEQRLRRDLHRSLDAAAGPHPTWTDSPVARRIREDGPAGRSRSLLRRPPRSTLLLAAALGVVTLTGVLVVAGGRPKDGPPPPSTLPVAIASVLPPSEGPSPSEPVEQSSTGPVEPSAAPCLTTWTHHGTYPKGGLQDGSFLWRLEGDGGHLYMQFLNSIDTVKTISIVAVDTPPLVDAEGRKIHIAGTAFYKLVIDGLTRATEITRDDMKADDPTLGPAPQVEHPIAEARRLWKPEQAGTPTQHEIWIIGVDYPACLSVRTMRDPDVYEVPQSGDNEILVTFERRPADATPSPSPPG